MTKIVFRVLEDLEPFLGFDGPDYGLFERGDVTTLPVDQASVLVGCGVIEVPIPPMEQEKSPFVHADELQKPAKHLGKRGETVSVEESCITDSSVCGLVGMAECPGIRQCKEWKNGRRFD